jgi:hypothetical protein
MHRNLSKFATVALAAAIGLGVPALAKSTHSGKAKTVASLSTRDSKMQRQRGLNAGGLNAGTLNARALNAGALNAYGSVGRSPTFGAPNPNHPAFTGGGSTSYNANLYVY